MAMNPPLTDWRDQVVWLIGASSGIGRATASRLHAQGAKVVVSARNAQALELFKTEHPGSEAMPLDVTDVAAVHNATAALQNAHGRLDLVMYCAGHYQAMQVESFDLAEVKRHLDVNYVGALHVIDACLPVLVRQQKGHLSLVGSVAGYRGLPKALAYGPTKAALQQLAETLYFDLHPMGLGVSVINPGFVATPLTAPNDFEMPALLTPEQAATEIIRGWSKGRFEIHFPKRFTLWLKLLQLLPSSWYFSIVSRSTQTQR